MGVEAVIMRLSAEILVDPDVRNIVQQTMSKVSSHCSTVGSGGERKKDMLVAWPKELAAFGKVALCVKLGDALNAHGYSGVRVGIEDRGIIAHFEW